MHTINNLHGLIMLKIKCIYVNKGDNKALEVTKNMFLQKLEYSWPICAQFGTMWYATVSYFFVCVFAIGASYFTIRVFGLHVAFISHSFKISNDVRYVK